MANCASVMKKRCLCITSPSLTVADEYGKRHTMRAHLPEAVSDWLNPLFGGHVSLRLPIENLAKKSSYLINS